MPHFYDEEVSISSSEVVLYLRFAPTSNDAFQLVPFFAHIFNIILKKILVREGITSHQYVLLWRSVDFCGRQYILPPVEDEQLNMLMGTSPNILSSNIPMHITPRARGHNIGNAIHIAISSTSILLSMGRSIDIPSSKRWVYSASHNNNACDSY